MAMAIRRIHRGIVSVYKSIRTMSIVCIFHSMRFMCRMYRVVCGLTSGMVIRIVVVGFILRIQSTLGRVRSFFLTVRSDDRRMLVFIPTRVSAVTSVKASVMSSVLVSVLGRVMVGVKVSVMRAQRGSVTSVTKWIEQINAVAVQLAVVVIVVHLVHELRLVGTASCGAVCLVCLEGGGKKD